MRALAILLVLGIFAAAVWRLAGPAWADEAYREAERSYREGDFERARGLAAGALWWNPRHAAAFALKVEIDVVLGRWEREPLACEYGPYVKSLSYHQTLAEMDAAIARGGSLDLRRALEYAKWLPRTPEVHKRAVWARNLLVLRCETRP